MDTIKHTLTLYPSKSSEITTKSQTFQKTIRLLAKHNSIWHFAIYQSKDSSPLNVINIFWSIFNTHYVHHQAYTYALPIKILRDHNYITDISENYQTSRGTQFNLTLCDIPIKRLLASKCNKYILKYLQHTLWTPSSIYLRSTHQNPQRSQLNHRHFRKLSDFSRNTIQFDTLRFTNQKTPRL